MTKFLIFLLLIGVSIALQEVDVKLDNAWPEHKAKRHRSIRSLESPEEEAVRKSQTFKTENGIIQTLHLDHHIHSSTMTINDENNKSSFSGAKPPQANFNLDKTRADEHKVKSHPELLNTPDHLNHRKAISNFPDQERTDELIHQKNNSDTEALNEIVRKHLTFVAKAKLAMRVERYDEMVEYMTKHLAAMPVELTAEERNLLDTAYKSLIRTRRESWRFLSYKIKRQEFKNASSEEKWQFLIRNNYRNDIGNELRNICFDILRVLEKHLIPTATTRESKAFYYKMQGDYNRYLIEFSTGNDLKNAAQNSIMAYKTASNIAFDDAVAHLNILSEESFGNSTLIMQLFRDNLLPLKTWNNHLHTK